MRQIITGLLLLGQALLVQGQTNTTIKLQGIIVDSVSHKPLPLVSVGWQSATGSTIKSTVTTDKGAFVLPVSPSQGAGSQLLISYVGYRNKIIQLSANMVADMGTVTLSPSSDQLQGVTVNATKSLVKQEIDRLTYDVQADPQAKGQTAMDMLRRVPLITVDGDDNIQLQGSGSYRIFINGKPSALVTTNPKDALRAMPANLIQKIEVITTPPAKYDAEGLAGIINIITTKKTADGYNGTLTLRESIPYGPNLNVSATAKLNKFGFSAFGGTGIRPRVSTLTENLRRSNTNPDLLYQHADNITSGRFYFAGSELSYEIDTLQLLTGSFNYFKNSTQQDYDRQSAYYLPSSTVKQSYSLFSDGELHGDNIDLGLNYQLGFKHKKDRLLTTSYRYSKSVNDQYTAFTSSNRFNYDQPDNTQENSAGYKEQTIQVDYVHPAKNLTIEAGAKGILRDNYSDSRATIFVSPTGFVNDPSRTNSFDYRQDVYSIYNSYKLVLTKWTLQAGMRAEFTKVDANFTATATKLNSQYSNFIPSFSILRSLKNGNTIAFGITNRLSRPGILQLNPFVDKTIPQLVTTGNPDLKPVISHLFEVSYNKVGKSSLNTRLSYMYVNNSIENVTRIVSDTLSITSFDNVGQLKIARVNVNGNFPLGSKWNLNFNTGVFYVWIKGVYNGKFYSNEGPRTNTFVSSTFKANAQWQFGFSAGYNRRYINLQGGSNDYAYSSVSATLSLKKFTITGVVNNPFENYYSFTTFNDTPDFFQSNTSNLIFRNYALTVSYRFGKLSGGLKKNKRGINNDDATSTNN